MKRFIVEDVEDTAILSIVHPQPLGRDDVETREKREQNDVETVRTIDDEFEMKCDHVPTLVPSRRWPTINSDGHRRTS